MKVFSEEQKAAMSETATKLAEVSDSISLSRAIRLARNDEYMKGKDSEVEALERLAKDVVFVYSEAGEDIARFIRNRARALAESNDKLRADLIEQGGLEK